MPSNYPQQNPLVNISMGSEKLLNTKTYYIFWLYPKNCAEKCFLFFWYHFEFGHKKGSNSPQKVTHFCPVCRDVRYDPYKALNYMSQSKVPRLSRRKKVIEPEWKQLNLSPKGKNLSEKIMKILFIFLYDFFIYWHWKLQFLERWKCKNLEIHLFHNKGMLSKT